MVSSVLCDLLLAWNKGWTPLVLLRPVLDTDRPGELEGQISINELLDEPVGATRSDGAADPHPGHSGGDPAAVLNQKSPTGGGAPIPVPDPPAVSSDACE